LVAAAQASVDVSAKRQLAGEAGAVQHRLKQRLRQVAKTMPEIAMPHQPSVDRTIEENTPAAHLQPVPPEVAAAAHDPSAALAGSDAPAEPAAPQPLPTPAAPQPLPTPAAPQPPPTVVARAAPAAEPTTSGALESDQAASEAATADLSEAAVIERMAAALAALPLEVMPGPATIMPGAAPAEPALSDHRHDGRSVALLDVPPDVLALKTGQWRTPTWLRNAVEAAPDARPAVAVVIDDLGLNRRGTAALNRLRAPLTLAFLPYATDLDEQTRAARAAGHELLVHVPMEPRSQDWPGPNALTSQLGPAELVSRLRSHLRSFRGFVGVNNHMGSLLTTDPGRMAILMAELRQRGLLFLDSRTTPESVAASEAQRSHVPFAKRDVFIDNDLELKSVLRALAHAEDIARRQGHAVAMGHPHDVTIEALQRWLPTLDARGFALVPISAIVARQSCASGLILVGNACARYAVADSAVP
jgi:polysaccharide deacetylase 2 family uncharacterized protein YibQ